MKIHIYFVVAYIVLIGSIFSLYDSSLNNLNKQLILSHTLIIFILLLVSAIFIYFFRLFNSNIKKDEKIKQLNNSLNLKVNEEQAVDIRVIQQARYAQMGEMISMIAHQWRQPLNTITLTSNNLTLQTIMGEMDKDYFAKELALIDNYAQHLSNTINDFRTFFKTSKIKDITTINKLVLTTLEIIGASLEDNKIKILTDLSSSIEVQTYTSELKQVILSIIKNAEDILIKKKVHNPTISIITKTDANNSILIIKDNAGGIDKEIMEKIFDPYFSTKLEKNGTGLGLYMSKAIIQEHCGGTLHVENDKDGAVFTIVLGDSNE